MKYRYFYDSVGNLAKKLDVNTDQMICYEYDSLGRLIHSTEYWDEIFLYEYDALGNRTSKTVRGVTYYYTYQNGKVVRQTWYENGESHTMDFQYDNQGRPWALVYKGVTYYYLLNLQGDVIAILDSSGNYLAWYVYDAWGRVLSSHCMEDVIFLMTANPLRYRGYYYDKETWFYYLGSRYYDPLIKRFLNADVYASTGQGFAGYNMFAYCNNNPVNHSDPSGHSYEWVLRYYGTEAYRTFLSEVEGDGYVDPSEPPPKSAGYEPPKKNPNPQKTKNPNGPGRGWPSKDGGVWVPDNNMDGGPGWVVQYPDGSHKHVYPDGKVRTHKIASRFLGGAIIVVATAASAYVVANDLTGIGVVDNAALPFLTSIFKKGAELFVAS